VTASKGLHSLDSRVGRDALGRVGESIAAGRECYLLGISFGFHNSGAALLRVSADGVVELVCNEEEERYTAVKHCSDFPQHAVEAVKRRMEAIGLAPRDLIACVSSWDYANAMVLFATRPPLEEAPASFNRHLKESSEDAISEDIGKLLRTGSSGACRSSASAITTATPTSATGSRRSPTTRSRRWCW
jgi:hypothetical protein